MATGYTRFSKTWSNTGTSTDPSDAQANAGFAFLGATPPSVELFNSLMKWDDQKDNWLYGQIAAAIIGAGGTVTEANLNALRDAILSLKNLSGSKYYAATGTFTQGVDCPTSITRVQVHVWGGGGGAAGGTNGSGGGGGYSMGYITLTTSQVLTVTVGIGGTISPAIAGGTTTVGTITATGGGAGNSGAGASGVGSGGLVNLLGQIGQDLDAVATYVNGALGVAIGGNSPYGGFGGSVNAAGAVAAATAPGGGGGSNSATGGYAGAGAVGGALFRW